MHYTKEAFVRGIEKMTETGPGQQPLLAGARQDADQQAAEAMVAEYLATHFGPGLPDKKLKEEP